MFTNVNKITSKKRKERYLRWIQYKKLEKQHSHESIQKIMSLKRIQSSNNIEDVKSGYEKIIQSLQEEIRILKNTQDALISTNTIYKQFYIDTQKRSQKEDEEEEVMSLHDNDDLDDFISTDMEIPLVRRKISIDYEYCNNIEEEREMELHL